MIRVVTLDDYDPKALQSLCKLLYQAFGVGSEHSGQHPSPAGLVEPFDGHKLLEQAPAVRAFADDKVLYVTNRKLAPRKLVSGEAPTYGLSQYGGQRALISTAHIKNVPDNVKTVARFAMQEIGHTLGLHHCLDVRCAMYPEWVPVYLSGEPSFCVFCRDQSEQTIRMAKS